MKIHSKNRFSDSLTVVTGAKSMTLTVDVDLNTLATSMRKAKEVLAQVQLAAVKDPSPENMAAFGQGLKQLVECIFGAEQSARIIDFYEGNGEALLDDLMPYILRKIAPMAARISAQRRRDLEKAARKNARQRK